MNIVDAHETLDTLLSEWQPALGADYLPYRNHVYRVFNLSGRMASVAGEDREKLAIAAAFHDIGIWLDDTFDYLGPSFQRASEYLVQIGRAEWTDTIHRIIDQHHRIRPWRGSDQLLVESFRKADWLDVCLFALPSPFPKAYLTDLLRIFPRMGFQRRLVALTLEWTGKHPLNPIPVLKW